MKRMILVFVSFAILLTFSACNSDDSDIPSESGKHTHQPAVEEQTVSDPVTGYCGNTITTIYFDDDSSYEFWAGESVIMTDILINLDYDKNKLCKCLPEYTVDTEFGTGYGINLTEGYARFKDGQADLTEEQIDALKNIIIWALGRTNNFTDYDKAVSYAGWSEDSKIYTGCLNLEHMDANSVKHLPIFKIGSNKELNDFKSKYGDIFSFSQGYDEVPSFEKNISKYDDNFFKDNTLFIVYVTAGSGTYRFDVEGVYCNDATFRVDIKQTNNPEVVTMDMAGWFVMVSVENSIIDGCDTFDAVFSGIKY